MPQVDRETRALRSTAVAAALGIAAGLLVAIPAAAAQSAPAPAAEDTPSATTRPPAISTFNVPANGHVTRTLVLPPGEVRIVIDVRRADAREGAIQARVVIRGEGRVLDESVIDEEEVETRLVRRLPANHPAEVTMDLEHASDAAQYWVAAASTFVPFFGGTQPVPLSPARAEDGRLDKGEHAYYSARLAAGTYDVRLTLSNPSRGVTELRGSMMLLDGDGALVQRIVDIDELDVSARANGRFTTAGGLVLFKLYNIGGPRAEYYRTDFTLELNTLVRAGR